MTTVPAPEIVNTRSTNNRARSSSGVEARASRSSRADAEIVQTFIRGSRHADDAGVRQDRAVEPFADLLLREVEYVLVDEVTLRERDDAARHAEDVQDREVLLRLLTPAFVGGHDEQDQSDGPDAGEHVGDEPFVSRHVYEADLAPGRELTPRIAEVDRESSALLLVPSVRIHPGETHDQRGLAVVDMARGGHDAELHHLPVEVVVGARVVRRIVTMEVVTMLLVAFEGVVHRPREVRELLVRHRAAIHQDETVLDSRERGRRARAQTRGECGRVREPGSGHPTTAMLAPGIEPPPTADSQRTTRAPSSSPPIVSDRVWALLRTISGESRSMRNTGQLFLPAGGDEREDLFERCHLHPPMRTARAIGWRRRRSQRDRHARRGCRPAGRRAACRAENVTRSAPWPSASETLGSSSG